MPDQRKLGWIATREIGGRQYFVGACLAVKGRQRGIQRWLTEMAERPDVLVAPYRNARALAWASSLPHAPQARPGPDWDAIDRQGRR